MLKFNRFIKFIKFSETVNRKHLEEYSQRCRELKQTANYVEPSHEDKAKRFKKTKSAPNDSIIKEIKQIHNSKYNSELRKELFDGKYLFLQ